MRRALVLLLLLAFVTTATGCKRKKLPPTQAYTPPPRTAYSTYELRDLCSASAKGGFEGAPPYQKGASAAAPSKIAVFTRYGDDQATSYGELTRDGLGAMRASDKEAAGAQLVGCLDLVKEPGEPGHCTYYGGELLLHKMKHTLRVLEVKTLRQVLKEEFVLDHKTARCPGSYAFPKGVNRVYEGADYLPKLASLLLPLQPDGLALPPLTAASLDDVCMGSVVPQAAAYVPKTAAKVHVVYFPDAVRSDTRDDPPKGMPELDDTKADAAQYALVARVTGQAKKKRRDCEFSSGKVLVLNDGEFELQLFEARTGKRVETRTFKGTSPDGCPFLHKFWGQKDDVMTKVDASMGKYLASLERPAR